jgi:hypothetical protein
MSADGRYMLQGELVDVQNRVSLTEPRRRQVTRTVIDAVGEDNMIVFKPEKVEHVVTVFTDIDCGYCRKLHNEMDQYLDEGIEVRYMMFPRAGVGSESYKKAVAVWCAEDRNGALTDAKNGKAVEMKSCDNPIDQHMETPLISIWSWFASSEHVAHRSLFSKMAVPSPVTCLPKGWRSFSIRGAGNSRCYLRARRIHTEILYL